MPEPRTLMTGLVVGESPRWHEGRLWFSNWGAQEVIAVDVEGNSEVVAHVPTTLPFSIDWLPDGRLLVVSGPEGLLLRREPDGSWATHADLRGVSEGWNEIVVDGRGSIYLNSPCFRLGKEEFRPGILGLVTPDGSVRQVADDIAFPNGMVVTPDNATLIVAESFAGRLTAFDIAADGGLSHRRVWAELGQGGDGICLDADGAVWTPVGDRANRRPACGSAKGARCCSGSSSTGPASPACWGATTAGRCSCWRRVPGPGEPGRAVPFPHRSAADRPGARTGRRLAVEAPRSRRCRRIRDRRRRSPSA